MSQERAWVACTRAEVQGRLSAVLRGGAVVKGMQNVGGLLAVAVACAAAASSVWAQAPSREQREQRQMRYQVSQMERVLEGAVEHGAVVTRDRLQAVVPDALLLAQNARVRGFRLDGYGVFFDVEVPTLPTLRRSLAWSFRTLDQNDLGLTSALGTLRQHVETLGDQNLEQALRRLELQVGPVAPSLATPPVAPPGTAPVAPAARAASQTSAALADASRPVTQQAVDDPIAAYTREVKDALIDAMLDHSGSLRLASDEWLTIAARADDDHAQLAPADPEVNTLLIRVRGADLAEFRAGRLTREEAVKKVEVRSF